MTATPNSSVPTVLPRRFGPCRCALTGLALLAAGLAAPAGAQAPPMDMSGMMANQMYLQQQGDMMARQAAMDYYNRIQQYRQQTGYTGYIPPPVSAQQLQQSINGANQATQDYIQNSARNSNRTSAAIETYDQQVIRGQQTMVNPYTGQVLNNVPNTNNNYYQTDNGAVHGTDSYNLPPGATQLQPVKPQW